MISLKQEVKIALYNDENVILDYRFSDGVLVRFDLSKGIKNGKMRSMLAPYFITESGKKLVYTLMNDYYNKNDVLPVNPLDLFKAIDFSPDSIHTVIVDVETNWSIKNSYNAFSFKNSNSMTKNLMEIEDYLKYKEINSNSVGYMSSNIEHFYLEPKLTQFNHVGIVLLNNCLHGYGGQLKECDSIDWEDFIAYFLTALSSNTKNKMDFIFVGNSLYCDAYSRFVMKDINNVHSFKRFDSSVLSLIFDERNSAEYQLQLLS